MDLANAWLEKNFEIIWTEDGSPSLKPLTGFEMMHHRGGAFAETQLIYGNVIRETLEGGGRSFLSVGLGLGYNEMVIAEEALVRGLDCVQIRSFETEEVLKTEFLDFLENRTSSLSNRSEVYQNILRRLSRGDEIPAYLAKLQKTGHWQLEGALNSAIQYSQRAQAILFDAYSTKTSPDLWTEEFLTDFLNKSADFNNCLFSTYACTGVLKRALKGAGFEVILREGFHGKRNSTLGRRVGATATTY